MIAMPDLGATGDRRENAHRLFELGADICIPPIHASVGTGLHFIDPVRISQERVSARAAAADDLDLQSRALDHAAGIDQKFQ